MILEYYCRFKVPKKGKKGLRIKANTLTKMLGYKGIFCNGYNWGNPILDWVQPSFGSNLKLIFSIGWAKPDWVGLDQV